jgi:hypothetical protein
MLARRVASTAATAELPEAEMAVGDERAHVELRSEREGVAVVILGRARLRRIPPV